MDIVLVCFYKYFQYYSDCCPVGKDGRTWPEVQCLMGNQITYICLMRSVIKLNSLRESSYLVSPTLVYVRFLLSVSQNKCVENGEKARVRQFRTSSVTCVHLFMFGFLLCLCFVKCDLENIARYLNSRNVDLKSQTSRSRILH